MRKDKKKRRLQRILVKNLIFLSKLHGFHTDICVLKIIITYPIFQSPDVGLIEDHIEERHDTKGGVEGNRSLHGLEVPVTSHKHPGAKYENPGHAAIKGPFNAPLSLNGIVHLNWVLGMAYSIPINLRKGSVGV